MPELPEVEMMAALFRERAENDGFVGIETVDARVWGETEALRKMRPQVEVSRRGKWLLVSDEEQVLLIHFRMSGQLVSSVGATHERVRFHFERGEPLSLRDPRALACVTWCMREEVSTFFREKRLGDEFWPERRDGVWWSQRIGRTRGLLKGALLRQDLVAGVGNIAVSEILWLAGISPKITTGELSAKQWDALAEAAHQHVSDTLAREEAASLVFVNHGGPNLFQVYGREGEPCSRCDQSIQRVRQQGRSTFYCGQCQAGSAPARS